MNHGGPHRPSDGSGEAHPRWARNPPRIAESSRGGGLHRFVLAFAILAIASAAPSPASAQGTGPGQELSLVEAVERALEHYPSVAVSEARRDAAHAVAGQAAAARWPTVSLGLSATQYEKPTLVTPIRGFTPESTPDFDRTLLQSWGTMSYTVFDGGTRGSRIDMTRARSASTETEVDDARQTIMAVVAIAYLGVLSRQEVLEANERQLAALEAERDRIDRLLAADRAAEVDRLRVEAALASAEADRVGAAAGLDVARREMARLIGTDPEATRPERLVPLSFVGAPPPPREELETAGLQQSPRVAAARHEVTAADAGVSVARSARWPRVELAGTYIDRGSSEGDFTSEWFLGLQLFHPIFTGGHTRDAIAEAEAQLRGAREVLRLEEARTSGALDRGIAAVEEAEARVTSLTTAVARSTEVARIEQLRMETGTGTQAEYLRTEADLYVARAGLVEARHAELASRVELARLTGTLDLQWLRDNLEEIR
jgi:outer membrane protein TolC